MNNIQERAEAFKKTKEYKELITTNEGYHNLIATIMADFAKQEVERERERVEKAVNKLLDLYDDPLPSIHYSDLDVLRPLTPERVRKDIYSHLVELIEEVKNNG